MNHNKTLTLANDSLAASPGVARISRQKKRRANRNNRRAVRQALHTYNDDFRDDAFSLEEIEENRGYAEIFEADFTYNERIKEAMWDRRVDNLGAGYRWADRRFADTPYEDLRTTVFGALPDTVAGRHLAGHIVQHLEFRREAGPYRRWRRGPTDEYMQEAWMRLEGFRNYLIEEIINNGMKRRWDNLCKQEMPKAVEWFRNGKAQLMPFDRKLDVTDVDSYIEYILSRKVWSDTIPTITKKIQTTPSYGRGGSVSGHR